MIENLEEKILNLYNTGIKNREIARELGIHHNTVKYWLDKNNLKAHFYGLPIDMVDDIHARCRRCLEIKIVNDNFQFGRKNQQYEYRFAYCNLCRKKQSQDNLNNDINKFLSNNFNKLKLRCKKDKIFIDLTKIEFINQYNKQNGLCFYSDEEMVCQAGKGKNRNSLSIDKIIPEKGYIVGNFVFCINKINTCKNDLSLEEIEKWMPEWYLRILKFIDK